MDSPDAHDFVRQLDRDNFSLVIYEYAKHVSSETVDPPTNTAMLHSLVSLSTTSNGRTPYLYGLIILPTSVSCIWLVLQSHKNCRSDGLILHGLSHMKPSSICCGGAGAHHHALVPETFAQQFHQLQDQTHRFLACRPPTGNVPFDRTRDVARCDRRTQGGQNSTKTFQVQYMGVTLNLSPSRSVAVLPGPSPISNVIVEEGRTE